MCAKGVKGATADFVCFHAPGSPPQRRNLLRTSPMRKPDKSAMDVHNAQVQRAARNFHVHNIADSLAQQGSANGDSLEMRPSSGLASSAPAPTMPYSDCAPVSVFS